jgi:hypothetical protein
MRAKNEIALINTQNHEVFYGVDALLLIIGSRFPFLKRLFQINFFTFIFKRFYKFISLNRRIIAPSKSNQHERDCTPEVNLFYRWLYIIMIACFSSIVLFLFSKPINQMMGWESSFLRELSVCFGQILWQVIFLHKQLKSKLLDYLGNMLTVSLLGSLLLIPILVLKLFFSISPSYHILYFMIVVSIMLIEHLRRCNLLKINVLASISWVLYRFFVLLIIIFVI